MKMLSHVVPYSSLQCFWQYFLQNLLFLHLPALLHLTVQAVSSQVAGGGADVGGGGGGLVVGMGRIVDFEKTEYLLFGPKWAVFVFPKRKRRFLSFKTIFFLLFGLKNGSSGFFKNSTFHPYLVGAPTTGHSEEQNPHAPCPPTWSSLESVRVEHHGSVSPGALPSKMHSL